MVFARSLICPTMFVISSTDVTATPVSSCMAWIMFVISSVASLVCLASSLISFATTANPFPASPALAASMVALSARRLVCSAMVLITWIMLPILSELSPSLWITSLALWAFSWASLVMEAVWATLWAISVVASVSSWDARVTDIILSSTDSAACTTSVTISFMEVARLYTFWLMSSSFSDASLISVESRWMFFTILFSFSAIWLRAFPSS